MPPVRVVHVEDGESDDEARARCGVGADQFHIIIYTVDASTPRDAP
jgi:hypothetical protein